jgi:hypothetical protein
MTEPPAHALPLLEALQRFSDPEDLAALEGKHPQWMWHPHSSAPHLRATNSFFSQLHGGELLCWARHQSPVAPWSQSPPAAWPFIKIGDWRLSMLVRLGRSGVLETWFEARVAPVVLRMSPVSEAELDRWYRDYVASGARLSDDRDWGEAQKHFEQPIPRERFREVRRTVLELLEPHQLKRGRRPRK